MRKTVLLAATFALALAWAKPAAADAVTFDPTGGGGGFTITSLDWLQGNTIVREGTCTSTTSCTAEILYQANLDAAVNGNTPVFSNGDGGDFFTATAALTVTINPTTGSFTIDSGTINVYATTAAADDLAGTGFTSGTLILSTSADSGGGGFTFFNFTPQDLDQFEDNDYPGVQTFEGAGGSTVNSTITFVDNGYFPSLGTGAGFLFFINTSLVDPFRQIDPANMFFDGSPGVPSVGAINGTGSNIIAQADANSSFETPAPAVPEPASLVLLGSGLLASSLVRRRRSKKSN